MSTRQQILMVGQSARAKMERIRKELLDEAVAYVRAEPVRAQALRDASAWTGIPLTLIDSAEKS